MNQLQKQLKVSNCALIVYRNPKKSLQCSSDISKLAKIVSLYSVNSNLFIIYTGVNHNKSKWLKLVNTSS